MPALLQVFARLVALKRLGVLLFVLAATLCAANNASALEPARTKTSVWGFDFVEHNSDELLSAATSGKHQGNRSALSEIASGSLLAAEGVESLAFSQTTASAEFSAEGDFAGKTIGGLAGELRSGAVAASDVPVKFVNIGGNSLIVNTRSSLALTRAGIPQSGWTLIDATATDAASIEARLLRNGLTAEGTSTLRITGLGSGASSLR